MTLVPSFGTDSAKWLGPGIHVLDGRVLRSAPDTVALAVSRALGVGGVSTQKWHGDRVALPRAAVMSVERRQLSYFRTGLLVSAAVIAAVALDHAVATPPTLR